MASSDKLECDLFECQICFDPILEKTPRTLRCNHTFCESCLKQLLDRYRRIVCPTCRVITGVPLGDISKLPRNYDLAKMKEREEELLQRARQFVINSPSTSSTTQQQPGNAQQACEVCMASNRTKKRKSKVKLKVCHECQLTLCGNCADIHKSTPRFSDHTILESPDMVAKDAAFGRCDAHGKNITLYCLECDKGLCVVCSFDKVHQMHKHDITNYKYAAHQKQQEISRLSTRVRPLLLQIKERLNFAGVQDSRLDGVLSEIETKKRKAAEEAEVLLTSVREQYRNPLGAHIEKLRKGLAEGESILTKEGPPQEDGLSWRQRYKNAVECVEEAASANFILPMLKVEGEVGTGMEVVPVPTDGPHENKQLHFMCKVRHGVIDLIAPYELVVMNNLDVLVCDAHLSRVIQLNQQGHLIAQYYPYGLDYSISTIDVHDSTLYLGNQVGICKLPLGMSPESRSRKKPVVIGRWSKMVVDNEESIFVTDFEEGRIYKVDYRKNQLRVIVEDLCSPSYISLARRTEGMTYLVTEEGERRVNIYCGCCWILKETTGQKVSEPRATCQASEETFFVVDRGSNIVKEFCFGGALVRNIPFPNRLQNPCGIAYKYPILWISECDEGGDSQKAALKCFAFS